MSALACGAYDAYSAWRAVCVCLRLRGCVCVRVGSRPEMTLGVRGHYNGFTLVPPPPTQGFAQRRPPARGALGWAMSAPKIVNDKRTLYVGACARAPRRP